METILKIVKLKLLWILFTVSIASLSCFSTKGHARDITLAWDSDPAVDGYMLYYKMGSSGPPYNGTGAAEGDSPIDVGWISEFTLRALSDDEDYYFVVTAYTQDGESGYSNEVTTAHRSAVVINSNVSSDGGGGGGCFISALKGRSKR